MLPPTVLDVWWPVKIQGSQLNMNFRETMNTFFRISLLPNGASPAAQAPFGSRLILKESVKNQSANAGATGDVGLIPGTGRSPGGVHGNPLQYSCLENPMDRGSWWSTVHRVTKSQA